MCNKLWCPHCDNEVDWINPDYSFSFSTMDVTMELTCTECEKTFYVIFVYWSTEKEID